MTGQQAKELLNKKLKEAESLIEECEALADEHYLSFRLETAYGMGGTYQGQKPRLTRAEALTLIEKGDELSKDLLSEIQYVLKYADNEEKFADRWSSSSETGWMSSSAQC